MNSKDAFGKRHHRVLVALTDSRHRGYYDDPSLDKEIKLLDNKAMLLRIQKAVEKPGNLMKPPRYYRHMEFDAIGYDFESHIRSEFTDFIVQMFRYHRHGSLLRFSSHRSFNSSLLTRLLVTEVDKVINDLRFRIKLINVDYFDVRKFDMINLLLNPKAIPSPRRDLQSGKSFSSTKELFQWLMEGLPALRPRGMGDDFLDFEFVYRGSQPPMEHKIRLSVFNIFNGEQRTDVAEFFKSVYQGKQSGVTGTLLSDCLKESFDLKSPTPTLVMFELPMVLELSDCRRKVLKLADMAYSSLEKSQQIVTKIEQKYSSQISIDLGKESSRSSLISVPNIPLAYRRRNAKYSDQDYNGLASWYHRIDSKFTQLKLGMEQHFVNLFERKGLDLRRELSCINEEMGLEKDESGGDASRPPSNPTNADDSEREYLELQREFKKLELDAAKTAYASTLKVYISTKNYELSEAEKTLKKREIDNLRVRLVEYLRN